MPHLTKFESAEGCVPRNRMDKAVLANYSSVQIQGGSFVEATGLDTANVDYNMYYNFLFKFLR